MWLTLLKNLKSLLNPTVLLTITLVSASAAGVGYYRGAANTRNAIEATEAKIERSRQVTYDAALAATAEEISKIQINHRTIRQELEREIRTETKYVDCRSSDDVVRLLNAVLTGTAPAESVDSGELSGVNAPDGQ
jgi:hypothetical protein